MRQVVRLARLMGWLAYHTHDSRRSDPGFPDLVLVRGTRLIFAELKSDRGKVRPEQAVWLDLLAVVPTVEVYIWRPEDWDAIASSLQR